MPADQVNYLVRPNKNVERKLFLEMFRRLEPLLVLSRYRYVGLGGLWFGDFVLMHRELGTMELVSIEMRQPARAKFNRPFACVTVEPGESTVVLPRLGLGQAPCIVWLDYDSDLSGPALTDIEILMTEVAAGSICLVTVQADVRSFTDAKGPDDQILDRLEAVELVAEDLIPLGTRATEITASSFPALVAEILVNAFEHEVNQVARGLGFQLLVNVAYRDGTPMVTVGGYVYEEDEGPLDLSGLGPLPLWPAVADQPHEIEVPHLTLREKAALDQMMPGSRPPTEVEVEAGLGFRLSAKKLAAYHAYYRKYPFFAEYDV